MEIYISQFAIFLLLLARMTSLVVVAPILGHQTVPVQFKVALGLFLSLVMFPVASSKVQVADFQFLAFIVLVLREIFVGLVIGFASSLIFSAARYAGDLIGFDMGLSLANAFDPETGQHRPVVGELLFLLTSLIFLVINGHHSVLGALYLSYSVAPIGTFGLSAALSGKLIELTGTVFIIAFKLAAPVIVAIFLTSVALAVLSRVIPQMNVFIVSFPLKIGVGLIVLMTIMPLMVYVFKKLLSSFQNNVLEIVKLM